MHWWIKLPAWPRQFMATIIVGELKKAKRTTSSKWVAKLLLPICKTFSKDGNQGYARVCYEEI